MPVVAAVKGRVQGRGGAGIRWTGQVYLTIVAAPISTAATANTIHEVAVPTTNAHTPIAAITNAAPGRIGTMMPASPTAMPTHIDQPKVTTLTPSP